MLSTTIKKIEYEKGKQIEILQFEVDEQIRQDALDIAKRKAPYTMKWSVSNFERNEKRQLNNLWQGKIADKGTMKWLVTKGFSIEEYDQIRTDNFKHPDPWDLRIIKSNIEIEVRSSCLAKTSHDLAYVINNYKLLGPYTIPGFKDSEKAKYLHIQVIYPYPQVVLNKKLENEDEIYGYIMGWISREELFTRGFDWHYQKTKYKVVILRDARQMFELVEFLKSF